MAGVKWMLVAIGTAALLLVPECADAADLGRPGEADNYAFATSVDRSGYPASWSGFYIGGTLGYAWGEGRTAGDIGSIRFDQSGVVGLVHAGYNWQAGRAVLGVEADVGTGDLGSATDTAVGRLRTDLNAMGSLRARIGFLAGPALLIYGTAGLAWADFDFDIAGGKARSEAFLGYQVGIGGEYRISDKTSLRLEYIYTGLPEERVHHSGLTNSYDPSFNALRAGISFKF
jgi:outer membrane immunogenic protein